MSDIAIRVEGLSKRYTRGVASQVHDTLRDLITHGLGALTGRNGHPVLSREDFWALKDVSFEVKHGEVLGIIGSNGAGKSTLLKILSRITEPTSGRAQIHGRVGSLLEVGTGFDWELTGRENIYLSGAILGMRKAEIERKFDEIVDFSGVERFIDTPVKRYSSGMFVRLAFAVAAHLEPEILIVDEVLAVGDIAFQKKCLGKMEEAARGGRTVVLVSHNMGAIANLCTSAMWLSDGKIKAFGDDKTTVSAYLKQDVGRTQKETGHWRRSGTGEAIITNAALLGSSGTPCATFLMGETITLQFEVEFYQDLSSAEFSLQIERVGFGMNVVHVESQDDGFSLGRILKGKHRFRVEMPDCLLYPAEYQIGLCVWAPGVTFDNVSGVLNFSMVQSDVSKRTYSLSQHKEAVVFQRSRWQELA